MSLFTDLKEVLTPYAQRIKGLAAADDEINADLSTLDRKVDANDKKIKADLDALDISVSVNPVYTAGTINSSNGMPSTQSASTRIYTSLIAVYKKLIIDIPSGYKVYVYLYSGTEYSTFIGKYYNGWINEDVVIDDQNGKYVALVFAKSDDGNIDISDLSNVVITSYDATDKTLSLPNKPADAEATKKAIEGLGAEVMTDGSNLLKASKCVDSTTISTSGIASTNNSYWITGYIDVSDLEYVILPPTQKLRYAWYSDKTESSFVSYGTKYNPLEVPTGANYLRICYAKSVIAFADRWKLMVVGIDINPSFETDKIVSDKLVVSDSQYFYRSGVYTESFDFTVIRGDKGNSNMVVSYKGTYTGNAPTIQFLVPYNHRSNLYTSQVYSMTDENMEWRIPAFPDNAMQLQVVVTIPTGTTLTIKHLFNAFDNSINRTVGSYALSAHLGTVYPKNTMLAFNASAKLGYPYCVTVPKRTSDGVWVCFHDDSNVGNTLRMPDGSNLPSADASKSISDFTYTELMQYDAGIKSNPLFGGEKIPTLEAFFSLCQKTGMHPVLSIHPVPSMSEWAEIKALSDKYNVTQFLTLKQSSTINILSNGEGAYAVFGDEIECYMLVCATDRDAVSQMQSLSLDLQHAKMGIEWTDDIITQSKASNTVTNGFICGCFVQNGTSARYRELMSWGVTEITDDNNNSFGLNW